MCGVFFNTHIGENVMCADNQQERLHAQWIVGFVDGEGCFHVSINRMQKMKLGWQVLPEFRVVQHQRDESVLYRIKNYFGFGEVTVNHEDRKEYRVRGLNNLNNIVDFFQQYRLCTSKRKNLELFVRILDLMNQRQHLTKEGLDVIALLASQMNRRIKREYVESSETLRQTSFDEDKVRPLQRCKEVNRNIDSPQCGQ